MGCGKTTTAQILATQMGLPEIDLDEYIAQREGQSISEIFAQRGEVYFRRKEKEYLEEILQKDAFVLALGGGTPCYWENMQRISNSGATSIYLLLSGKALYQRLSKEKQHRPLIAHLPDEQLAEFLHKHLFERQAFYAQASFYINTEGKTPQEVVQMIRQRLNQ